MIRFLVTIFAIFAPMLAAAAGTRLLHILPDGATIILFIALLTAAAAYTITRIEG